MPQAICCAECSWPIPAELWNREGARCPGCRQRLEIAVFPAIERTRSGALPQALSEPSEASCFYHPESRAVIPCQECGRFLCGLCDIEIDQQHFCPKCFHLGVSSDCLETAVARRTLYDTVALAWAIFPALLLWPVIFGAPAALFTVIRRWNAPRSILPRTRVRFYLAAFLAVAELGGVGYLIWNIMRVSRLGRS